MPDNLIVQQANQDVLQATETLLRDIQRYREREDIASLLSAAPKFNRTVDGLIEDLTGVAESKAAEIDSVDLVKNINYNAATLLKVTRTWSTLRDALDQRSAQSFITRLRMAVDLLGTEQETEDSLIQTNAIGDRVVGEFYGIAREKNLRLKIPDAELVTVLRDDRLHSEAFGEPTPFIVGPLWGYNQAWNYIAYAHETGHHIYRNVDGLNCELLVYLMLTLGACGWSRSNIHIWGAWLEEIFADLFCLFRMGPAAIHAGQRVGLWLGAASPRVQGAGDTITQVLLCSRDLNHAPQYLRIHLGLEAIKLFENGGPGGQEAQNQVEVLRKRWEELAKQPEYIYINDRKEKFIDTLSAGRLVLNTILNTPLISLAENDGTGNAGARSVLETFYVDDRFKTRTVKALKQEFVTQVKNPEIVTPVLPEMKENWSVLAAAELARDDLPLKDDLQNLHYRTVANIEYQGK